MIKFLILCVIIPIIAFVGGTIVFCKYVFKFENDAVSSYAVSLLAGIALSLCSILLSILIIIFSGGAESNYSKGVSFGYVYDVNSGNKLLRTPSITIFDRNTRETTNVKNFSFKEGGYKNDYEKLLGKKVRIEYSEWLIPPFTNTSNKEVVSIELLEE